MLSPLPAKASISALYGICLIKILSVLYNLHVLFQVAKRKSGGKRGEEMMRKEMLHLKVSSGLCESFKTTYISAFIYCIFRTESLLLSHVTTSNAVLQKAS